MTYDRPLSGKLLEREFVRLFVRVTPEKYPYSTQFSKNTVVDKVFWPRNYGNDVISRSHSIALKLPQCFLDGLAGFGLT